MDRKRTILYLSLVLALILGGQLPFRAQDVGELRPAEALVLSAAEGQLYLVTDAGDRGSGPDLEAAMEDLKASAPGVVFHGTVRYLLLEDSALSRLPELAENRELNPACALCRVPSGTDPEAAAAYLRAHPPETDLRLLRAEPETILPRLRFWEGRFSLVQP